MQFRRILKKMYNMKEMLYVSAHRKTATRLTIYATCLLLAVAISLSPYFWQRNQPLPNRQEKFQTDMKYILFLNGKEKRTFPNKARQNHFSTGQSLFIKQKCSFINCYITYNQSLVKNDWYFDAIVFDIHFMRHNKIQNINLTRAAYQKYIFRALDSSESRPICNRIYDNFFNWTWSYKLNSDIPSPFINIYDLKNTRIGPKNNMSWIEPMNHSERYIQKVKQKSKAVAWIVDRCQLKKKHEDYFKELRDELNEYNLSIDTYGQCGENKCPNGALYKCYKMIEKQYYFQMVFEESFAEDYVTEKLVKVLQLALIPIVSGGAEYSNFLPPGSYLNTLTLELKKVAAIIDYLIKHPKIYSYFFDWKNYYVYSLRPKDYVCDLCAKLNDMGSPSHSLQNFRAWWLRDYKETCIREFLYHKFAQDDVVSSSNSSPISIQEALALG